MGCIFYLEYTLLLSLNSVLISTDNCLLMASCTEEDGTSSETRQQPCSLQTLGLDVYLDRLSKVSIASSGILALVRQATCILDCILRRACILGSPKSQSPAEPRPSPPCASEASSAVLSIHFISALSELKQG